jgi:ABC-type maltose transport system permease subunit
LSIAHASNAQVLVAFAIDAVVGGAVWIHADRNGIRHQTAWALFVVFFLLIALPIYILYFRSQRRKRGQP